MKNTDAAYARLKLPRLLNGVELAPEGTGPGVDFNLGSLAVQKKDAEVAVCLSLEGQSDTFACLFLSRKAAEELALKLTNVCHHSEANGQQ